MACILACLESVFAVAACSPNSTRHGLWSIFAPGPTPNCSDQLQSARQCAICLSRHQRSALCTATFLLHVLASAIDVGPFAQWHF